MKNLNFADVKNHIRTAVVPVTGAAVALGSTVLASAAGESTALPSVAITTEMLSPLVEGVVANVGVILPIGIGLFGIFLGIRLIPKLVSKFARI